MFRRRRVEGEGRFLDSVRVRQGEEGEEGGGGELLSRESSQAQLEGGSSRWSLVWFAGKSEPGHDKT